MNAFPKDWQLSDIHVKYYKFRYYSSKYLPKNKKNQTLPLQNKNNLLIRILKTETYNYSLCSIRKHIFNLNLAHPSSI